MKKPIEIEKLLKWTYCDELPKGGGSGAGPVSRSAWSAIESYVQLLTKVDDNKYGVVPTLSDLEGDPHPDALKVHEAVTALDDHELDLPEGWNPMPELDAFPNHADMALKAACFGIGFAARRPADLVRKYAILGGAPDWRGDVPELKAISRSNGQPVWYMRRVEQGLDEAGNPVEYSYETDDGWNRNTKAPKAGAYMKHEFAPDPVPVLINRGEYQLWVAALGILAKDLNTMLETWDVRETWRPDCPWEGFARFGSSVLEDLTSFS